MPIPGAPTDSQTPLADLLGGVNRPQLNAFVANSQARNGLVSAQTQEAMIKASQAQEEQQARQDLNGALVAAGHKQSDANLLTDIMVGGLGNAESAFKAYGLSQIAVGGNPSNPNPGQVIQGQQVYEGKAAAPVAVPPNSIMPPGSALAGVTPQQTPLAAAQTAAANATAGLHGVQAAAGGYNPNTGNHAKLDPVQAAEVAEFIRQNPNLSGNMRSLLSNGGPDVVHAFMHPEESAGLGVAPSAPANGITPAPGVSLQEQSKIRGDFANGLGARQATALNTMVEHSQLYDAIADQMDNGNFTPTNYITQLWKRTFGSPVPSNLHIAGSFLGREAVRATVNSGAGTGEERELQTNESSSPDALHGAAATLRSLASSQLHSLDIRAQRGGVDIAQLLGPQAQAVFGRHPVTVQTPSSPNATSTAAPTPLRDQLPGGATGPGGAPAFPSFPSEAAARAAGHGHGEYVIIGGVGGTLD